MEAFCDIHVRRIQCGLAPCRSPHVPHGLRRRPGSSRSPMATHPGGQPIHTSSPSQASSSRLSRSSTNDSGFVSRTARSQRRLPCAATRGRSSGGVSSPTGGAGSARHRIQELYGGAEASVEGDAEHEEEEYEVGEWEDEGEGEQEEEDDGGLLARYVVQVRTLHRVPNFMRPWEEGHDSESTSSGFVVAVELEGGAMGAGAVSGGQGGVGAGGAPRRQLLLMTTAGAVEHAKKVEVSRSADDAQPFPATVAAVCLDLDVALLRVDDPDFWGQDPGPELGAAGESATAASGRRRVSRSSGGNGGGGDSGGGRAGPALVPLRLDPQLPYLRKPVVVAGFPLGGGSLCVTSGVVSRIEVVEYSHAGRALLALQVDAPLNNGGWGGPALCPSSGLCVGMAFQKFTSQTWMERYDEAVADLFGGGEDDGDYGDGGGDEGPEDDGGGGGGGPGQGGYDEDAENIGYLVPSELLGLVLRDYARELSHQQAGTSAGSGTTSPGPSASVLAPTKRGGGSSGSARALRAGRGGASSAAAAETHGSVLSSGVAGAGSGPVYLDGRPRLGVRYQRMESPALRRALGMGPGQSGVLVTGVDPTASAAGAVKVHDVLLAVGGRQVANDGTTLLRRGQRVLFGHWAAVADVGSQLPLTVLRDGETLEVKARLRDAGAPFLPVSLGPGRRPQFLVVGPLVFVAFSLPYWYEFMAGLQQNQAAMRDPATRQQLQSGLVAVLGALEWGMPREDNGEEVVLLSEVLECGEGDGEGEDVTAAEDNEEGAAGTNSAVDPNGVGREGVSVGGEAVAWSAQLMGAPRRLASINGTRVRNLAHLAAEVVAASARATDAKASPSSGTDTGSSGAPGAGRFLRLGLAHQATSTAAAEQPRRFAATEGSSDGASGSGSSSGGGSLASSGSGIEAGVGTGGGVMVVMDAARLAADTRAVLQHHSMAAAMPADLRRRLTTSWPFEGAQQDQAATRRRRQQGRRFAGTGRR